MLIIATVEKYLLTEDRLKKLILSGADIFRFNFSYRTIEENLQKIIETEKVIDELNSSAKILIDFPINKSRLGDFNLKLFPVNEDDNLIFKSGAYSFDCYDYVPVQIPNLGEKLKLGQSITLGDGEISLQVMEIIDKESVRVKIQNKGVIQYMKTFNILKEVDEDKIIKIHTSIIQKTKRINPHFFAISFINHALLSSILNIIKQENINIKTDNNLSFKERHDPSLWYIHYITIKDITNKKLPKW